MLILVDALIFSILPLVSRFKIIEVFFLLFYFAASTKRSHEWASSCGVGSEQIHRQASTSPVRSSGPSVAAMLASASASPAPVSPSSSNASIKKKMVSP